MKNTPQQNPKEFKTKTEKQAKENDGKTSSIINLLDEIDTTLYVMKREAGGQGEFSVGRIFGAATPPGGAAGFLVQPRPPRILPVRISRKRHNQQRSLLKKASSSWETPM